MRQKNVVLSIVPNVTSKQKNAIIYQIETKSYATSQVHKKLSTVVETHRADDSQTKCHKMSPCGETPKS